MPGLACLVSFGVFLWLNRTGARTFFQQALPLGGDGLLTANWIKTFNSESSLHLLRPLLSESFGWPQGFDSAYYPSGNWIELSLIRLGAAVTGESDSSILLKTAACLKILLVALGAWWFGRQIRLTRMLSFVLTLCFSLCTFNIVRSFGHFGLGMTWVVPTMSAVFVLSWRAVEHREESRTTLRNRISIFSTAVVMFLCGLSSFYFAVFGVILALFIAAMILLKRAKTLDSKSPGAFRSKPAHMFGGMSNLVIPSLALATGLVFQVAPAIAVQRRNLPLLSTADRSWTESLVYSGTSESLFFDFHALILQLFSLPAGLNYLQTRATWEARQIGAVAGATAYLMLLTLMLRVVGVFPKTTPVSPNHGSDSDEASRLRVLLVLCFSLYFVGPLNFGLSRTIFPFIRAWGRLAPFITLFLVALLLLAIQRLRRLTIRFLLVALIVFVQLLEVNFYRKTFPDGRALASTADETRALRQSTLDDLGTQFSTNCPIAQLPIYPFPEYDSPNDSNGDYGLFDLPFVDDHRFRWSYGAIKNTDAARHYSPFVSQQPPFARISLGQQIQYWAALRPCGVVIDRTYLYVNEQQELDAIQARSQQGCARPLKGEKFKDSSRFVVINFTIAACQPRVGALTQQLVKMARTNEILWQPMTVGIERFERYWAMMPAELPHQLMYSVRGNRTTLDVRISLLVLAGTGPFANQPVELCVSAAETSCHSLFTNSAGSVELPMTLYASDELHSMLSVSINASAETPLEWGAILLPSNPDSAN